MRGYPYAAIDSCVNKQGKQIYMWVTPNAGEILVTADLVKELGMRISTEASWVRYGGRSIQALGTVAFRFQIGGKEFTQRAYVHMVDLPRCLVGQTWCYKTGMRFDSEVGT